MAEAVVVASVSDVPPGRVKVILVEGTRIALCNVGGTFYAVGDVCTHDHGPLGEGELHEFAIECPRHGARFDVRTGTVLCLPAVFPIPTYEVFVEGETVKLRQPVRPTSRVP